MKYIIMPQLQTSTGLAYGLFSINSGAIYKGVPHCSVKNLLEYSEAIALKPKSVNFTEVMFFGSSIKILAKKDGFFSTKMN